MILLLVITPLLISSIGEAGEAALNVLEYKSLCRILRIAEEFSGSSGIADYVEKTAPWSEFNKLRTRLEIFSNATNETKSGRITLDDKYMEFRFTDSHLQGRINRLLADMVRKGGELAVGGSVLRTKSESQVKAAAEDLARAVAGEAGVESDGKRLNGIASKAMGFAEGTSTAYRKGACGSEAAYGGKNLVTDLICICASHTDGSDKAACGFKASSGSHDWQDTKALSANKDDVWKTIYDHCVKKDKLSVRPTPEGITAAVETFEGLIGRGASTLTDGTKARPYFGSITGSGTTCSGVQANNGPCVKYKEGSSGEFEIDWLGKVLSARTKLLAADEFGREARLKLHELQLLVSTAEQTLIQANLSQALSEKALPTQGSPSVSGDSVGTRDVAASAVNGKKIADEHTATLGTRPLAASLIFIIS